jgi:hypothetical protein
LQKKMEIDPSRLLQSGTDYWKVQFEYYKHLMTINLAAVAAFGALLGGFYGGFTNATELVGRQVVHHHDSPES